jgi:hypothetical protein
MFARFSTVAEERGAQRWQTALDLVSRVKPFHEFPRADVGYWHFCDMARDANEGRF